MSEVNFASGTGVCGKCGQQLLQVEENGSTLCIICQSKKMISEGPQVKAAAPTEEQMSKVLAAAGISVKTAPQNTYVAPNSPPVPTKIQTGVFKDMVAHALDTMKALPMPKDLKQFKTVNKVISQMEGLLEDK